MSKISSFHIFLLFNIAEGFPEVRYIISFIY